MRLYEKRTPYNNIKVSDICGTLTLELAPTTTSSVYDQQKIFVHGYWDYFAFLPHLTDPKGDVLIIGLGAGTVSKQYVHLYPDISIDGVEIDEEVINVGREFFDMCDNNLKVHNVDGREFLNRTDKMYDIVIVDAFVDVHVPEHLRTKEFFLEVRQGLKNKGILALNVLVKDFRTFERIRNTMKSVFRNVYSFFRSTNSILIASDEDVPLDKLPTLTMDPYLKSIGEHIANNYEKAEFDERMKLFTDEK